MNENEFQNLLQEVLNAIGDDEALLEELGLDDEALLGVVAETYRERGVLTDNKGLVVTLADGSEFPLTIVKSK